LRGSYEARQFLFPHVLERNLFQPLQDVQEWLGFTSDTQYLAGFQTGETLKRLKAAKVE
jgi:hypothetical protein